jgi:hypothetical protein
MVCDKPRRLKVVGIVLFRKAVSAQDGRTRRWSKLPRWGNEGQISVKVLRGFHGFGGVKVRGRQMMLLLLTSHASASLQLPQTPNSWLTDFH